MPGLRSQAAPAATHSPRAEAMAQNLERIAWLMDRAIPIPGTKLRVGLDAILGLLPGGGDFATGLVQVGVVLVALKHYRVPKAVALQMGANVLLDTVVGTVPFLGDIFDMGFKANTRNLALLGKARQLQAQGAPMPSAPSVRFLVLLGAGLVGMLALLAVGLGLVTLWLFRLITHGPN